MTAAPNKPIAPALRPLSLGSSYGALRGLAWSPDAELAVATDDSVHVFVPRLTGSDGNPIPISTTTAATGDDARGAADAFVAVEADAFVTDTESRGQFTAHSRHIPVGAVVVPRGLNDGLHALQAPLLDALLDSQAPQRAAPKPAPTPQDCLLEGSWDVTNSVSQVAWSPSGVGRHSRPLLGVLTTSGTLLVYGEPLAPSMDAGGGVGRGRQNYDTSQWQLLWAAGTDMPVRGQRDLPLRLGDRIVSFAWTGAWTGPQFAGSLGDEAALRTLLVCQTDTNDLVVLSVLHYTKADGGVAWVVQEVARTALATHASGSALGDAAAGVQCSAWLVETTEAGPYDAGRHRQTCLVAYLAGSYVGFVRVTVAVPPHAPGEPLTGPFVHVDDNVTNGVCMALQPTAFLRMEPGVWTAAADGDTPTSFSCRVAVATPMTVHVLDVEVDTRGDDEGVREALPPQTYPAAVAATNTNTNTNTNPIAGLVVHAPTNTQQPLHHSLVRMAGTHQAHQAGQVYESTLPWSEGTPQWLDELAARVRSSTLAARGLGGMGAMGGRGVPHVQYFGLALAPGSLPGRRGVSAALVALNGVKGGSAGRRARQARGSLDYVYFGWQEDVSDVSEDATDATRILHAPPVSTEARMWSYMYAGGPPVVGTPAGPRSCAPRMAALLETLAATQRCSICDAPLAPAANGATSSACVTGHVFARCSATGLAITRPGASHACGVCSSRTMHLGMLLGLVRAADGAAGAAGAAGDRDDEQSLRQDVLGDVCRRCGGKFYD